MAAYLSLFPGIYNQTPRPTRFARAARKLGEVTVCASGGERDAGKHGMAFLALPQRKKGLSAKILRASGLLAGRYEQDIWNPSARVVFEALCEQRFNAILCHAALLLPLALALRDRPQNRANCKVIMDAREFYPLEFENNAAWRLVLGGLNTYLCERYLPKADAVFTVSPGLAEGYASRYGVQCRLLPSYADFRDLVPRQTPPSGLIRCIHHGGAVPGRKLEDMIETMRLLGDGFSLDFMLMPNKPAYLEALRKQAGGMGNVRFLAPVPMPEIVPFLTQYDIGLYILTPDSFNHRHALPNKLFEFIQARLAVAVGPSPDMAGLVREYGLGIVADDFTPKAMAAAFQSLTPSAIDALKQRSHAAAQELCWERNEPVIIQTLSDLSSAHSGL